MSRRRRSGPHLPSSRTTLLFGLFLLPAVLGLTPVGAIEIVGDPPDYLDRKLRPQWRLTPLQEALEELGEEIERPVALSTDLEDSDVTLILIEDTKSTVREVLELLERTQDLHFTVEPLRLVVRTGSEQRRQQRKLVNLNLRDYGLFFRQRSEPPIVRVRSQDEADSHPSPFGGFEDHEDEDEFAFEDLLERVATEGGDSEVQNRGNGNLMLLVTPEEEARLRSNLDQFYETIIRRSSWKIHFGWLGGSPESSSPTAGGLLPAAEVRALATSLEDSIVLSATAMSGQRASVARGWYQRVIDDAEINQTGARPVMNPVVRGSSHYERRAQLRPHVGLESTLLIFEADWVENLPGTRTQKIRVPATLAPSRLATSTSAKKGATGEAKASVASTPAMIDPGLTLALEHKSVWEWKPRGEVSIPRGYGLVLTAPGEGRQRVILFEEVQQ